MARFQTSIPITKSPVEITDKVAAYLQAQGFKLIDADEPTWKKGGSFSNPLFIRCQAEPGTFAMEAWVRFVILPGLHVGEFDLDGMFLIVQKRALKKHVDAIEQLVKKAA